MAFLFLYGPVPQGTCFLVGETKRGYMKQLADDMRQAASLSVKL